MLNILNLAMVERIPIVPMLEKPSNHAGQGRKSAKIT
jgi:hypothetical protein